MPLLSIPLSPAGNPPRKDTLLPVNPEAAVHPDT
jgi:hypothetical protein